MSSLNNRKIRKTIKDYIVLTLGGKYTRRLTKKLFPEILSKYGIDDTNVNNASQFYGKMNAFLKQTKSIKKDLEELKIKKLKMKNRLLRRFKRKEKKRQAIIKKKEHYEVSITLEVWTKQKNKKGIVWWTSRNEYVVFKNKTKITFNPNKRRSYTNNEDELQDTLDEFPYILWTGKASGRYLRIFQDNKVQPIVSPSPFTISTIINISNVLIDGNNTVDLKDIKMYNATFDIGNQFVNNSFKDSGNNRCVPELLYMKYNKYYPKRLKTYEDVVQELVDPLDYGIERINEGFSSQDIKRFCDTFRIPLYALDINEDCFLTNVSTTFKRNSNVPVLCYILANAHMYICDNRRFITRISQQVSPVRSNTGMMKALNIVKNIDWEKQDIRETDDLTKTLNDMMTENNKLYKANGYGGKLTCIHTPEKMIYCNENLNTVKAFCKEHDIKFVNQSLGKVFEMKFKTVLPNHKKSLFNSQVFKVWKNHGGIIKKLNTFTEGDYGLKLDINNAYPYALMNNRWSYKVYTITDEIEDFDEQITDGFYYTILDSSKFPYKSSGWFSNGFLQWYKNEGFEFKIKYQYKTNKTLPHDYFNDFCKTIENSKSCDFKKINSFIGYLGRSELKNQKVIFDTDKNTIINYYFGQDEDGNTVKDMIDNDFNISCDEINEKLVYKLTMSNNTNQLSNDRPIYNQILENNYINLYNVIKSHKDKTICYIHTDSVQFKSDTKIVKHIDDKTIGGLKNETPIIITEKEIWKGDNDFDELKIKYKKFKTFYEKDIGNTDDLIYWLYENGSCMINGDAGCGKTYLINKFKERLDMDGKKYVALAYTNKASILVGGQTIHKCFGLGINDIKIDSRLMKRLQGKDYLFIDEISMIGKDILAVLDTIRKKFPLLNIVCVGDFKQLPPVGERILENSSVWVDICKRKKLVLNIPKRNDDVEFHKNALNVFNTGVVNKKNYGHFHIDECKRHITYTNKLRVDINNKMMMKHKPNKYIIIEKHQDNDYGQDTYVYEGLPIMCICNVKDMNFINGCEYIVKSFDSNNIYCDDLEIPIDKFSQFFVPSYSITYYKSQGATFEGKYAIHQTNHLYVCNHALYTAITRTTNKDNILIV